MAFPHRPSPIAHRPSPIAHRPSPIAHRPSLEAPFPYDRHPREYDLCYDFWPIPFFGIPAILLVGHCVNWLPTMDKDKGRTLRQLVADNG